MTAAGLAGLAVSWWSSPIDRAVNSGGESETYLARLEPFVFAGRGIVPIGHAAFAFVLGVTLGVLIRRTVPAMATTFAVYAAVQIAMPLWVRSHLAAPDRTTVPIEAGSPSVSSRRARRSSCHSTSPVPGSPPSRR